MLRSIFALYYVVVRGLRGMAQSPLVQALGIATTAVCMLMLFTVLLFFQNARHVVSDWGIDVPITVYMSDGAGADHATVLAEQIGVLPQVRAAIPIEPAEALDRLAQGLGEEGAALHGLAPEIMPTTVEVYLHDEVDVGYAERLSGRLDAFEGVEEVAVMGPWVWRARELINTSRAVAFGLGLMVSIACTVIVWSMIRLAVFSRRAEIEILRVVGSTVAFVRGPFLVEGVLQGLSGSALALALLWGVFSTLEPVLESGLSLLFLAGSIRFFSPVELVVLLAFGGALGALGSRAAVSRYVEV